MLLTSYMLENTPDSYFIDNAKRYGDNKKTLNTYLSSLRNKYGLTEDELRIKDCPNHGYLLYLEFSSKLLEKVGIKNSQELNEYLLSYCGYIGYPQTGSGTKTIGLRINSSNYFQTPNIKPKILIGIQYEFLDRMCGTLGNIKNGKAPNYSQIKPAIDGVLEKLFEDDVKNTPDKIMSFALNRKTLSQR